MLVKARSGELVCAYAYADAGIGESTQDMVFAGHNLICENGSVLAESKLFSDGLTIADVDVFRLDHERQRMTTWKSAPLKDGFFVNEFEMELTETRLDRTINPHPFVPSDKVVLDGRCEEILAIQSVGLATRLRHIGCKTAVVGLSGGLDSTLALIVMRHAFERLGLDPKGMIAVTMPQGLSSMIVQKQIHLSEMMNVPLLGLIENMSYVRCPNCDEKILVFGRSHINEVADKFCLPVLAEVPLDPRIADAADAGTIEDLKMEELDWAADFIQNI
jgi:DNA-directed RNA polymerase subunit RPC12/RpoP